MFLEVGPPGLLRQEEVVVVIGVLRVLRVDLLSRLLKNIRGALQEQHPEDEVLVGGGIHPFAAQDVRRRVEVPFQFGKRQLRHGSFNSVLGEVVWRGLRTIRERLLAWPSTSPSLVA